MADGVVGTRIFSIQVLIFTFRLFFGMGIIWYFEVISFYAGGSWSTTTDVINMLQVVLQDILCFNVAVSMSQGVWVFLTFVCKRNVLQVILRRRDRLYSVVLQRSRSRSKSSKNISDRKIFQFEYFRRELFSAEQGDQLGQGQEESHLPAH